LRFLVEHALAGQQDQLKEYTIATMAFGRPESFDPRVDSLVRVQATRLRGLLNAYYESANEVGPVEITLPPGTYVPVFRQRSVDHDPQADALPHSPVSGSRIWSRIYGRRIWLLTAGVLALAAGSVWGILGGLKHSRPVALETEVRLSQPGEVLLSPLAAPELSAIFYASTREGKRLRIWRQQPNGQGARPLTPGHSDAFDMDLSPDGSWLTYWSSRDGGGIYLQPSEGGEEELLAAYGRSPRFSPNGRQILFWRQEPHTSFGKCYTKALPGPSEPVGIAVEFMDAHNPQWTPDGKVLICGTLRTNVAAMEHDLWVVPANQPGTPLKTGILPYLRSRGLDLHGRPFSLTSFEWHGDDLILAAQQGEATRLYQLGIEKGTWRAVEEPKLVTRQARSQDQPSLRGSHLAHASFEANLNVWSIPLGADGLPSGPPRRLTDDPGDEFQPSVSRDGRRLSFLQWRPPFMQVWQMDLDAQASNEAVRSPDLNRMIADPSGTRAFVRVMAGTSPQKQEIHEINLVNKTMRRVCADCGSPTSVAPQGGFVVHQTGSQVARLAVVRIADGARREILEHPHHGLATGRLSPDGNWIAFELDRGRDGARVFLAPFHGLDPVPAREWIAVSSTESSCLQPAWGPDGASLYFLCDSAGTRDLWMRRLTHAKTPTDDAHLIYRFDSPRLTPLSFHWRAPVYIGLSVGKGQAVLTLSELSSSVWFGRLR
jgi:Tol biopolymer transport system component